MHTLDRGSRAGLIGACLVVALLLPAPDLRAQSVPNILGVYEGSGQETAFACTFPGDNGTFTGSAVITIDSQDGSSFSGTGFIIFSDHDTTFSGTIKSDGSISGSFVSIDASAGIESEGTFSGSLDGDTLFIDYQGMETVGDTCEFFGQATLEREPLEEEEPSTEGKPELNPGSGFTQAQSLNSFVRFFTQSLGVRFATIRRGAGNTGARPISGGAMLQHGSGLAAGEGFSKPWGIWGSYTRSESEDDFVSTAFDASRNSFLGGLDFGPTENLVLGLSFGYENADIDTSFNRGEQESEGWTVAPYAAVLVGDILSFDLAGGYSNIDIDQFRTLPGTTTRVNSEVDSDRWFLTGNVNASKAYGNWYLSGRVGLLYAEDTLDSFRESNGTIQPSQVSRIKQLRIGGDVAYTLGAFEPYVTATWERDFQRTEVRLAPGVPQPEDDRDGAVVGLGVRYFGGSGITGGLEYSTVVGREDFEEHIFNVIIRADF